MKWGWEMGIVLSLRKVFKVLTHIGVIEAKSLRDNFFVKALLSN